MKLKSFRYCMVVGALTLAGLALFYFINYFVLTIALANSGLQPFLTQSVRALWLAFAFQSLLIALLYGLVAWRPHAVSREVIVLFGLLQLVEAVLLLSFAGSKIAAFLLTLTAIFVLVGSVLWPKRVVQPELPPLK